MQPAVAGRTLLYWNGDLFWSGHCAVPGTSGRCHITPGFHRGQSDAPEREEAARCTVAGISTARLRMPLRRDRPARPTPSSLAMSWLIYSLLLAGDEAGKACLKPRFQCGPPVRNTSGRSRSLLQTWFRRPRDRRPSGRVAFNWRARPAYVPRVLACIWLMPQPVVATRMLPAPFRAIRRSESPEPRRFRRSADAPSFAHGLEVSGTP